MEVSVELEQIHRRMSPAQVRLLEFVNTHPEAMVRANYAPILVRDDFCYYELQPWPVLAGEALRHQLGEASVTVSRLLRSLPLRIFDNDPVRIGEYFDLDPAAAEVIAAQIEKTDILETAVGRGDFIESGGTFKCIEFNLTSVLGGWESRVWLDRYLSVPIVRQFLAGIEWSFTDSVQLLFEHVITGSRHLADGGELNMAFGMRHTDHLPPERWTAHFAREYEAVAGRAGLHGTLTAGVMPMFAEKNGELWLDGRRIHVMVDLAHGAVSPPAVTALLGGKARVYNGPVTRILSDKLIMVLLSEGEESDLFSAEERREIAKFVPWTRRVESGFTAWQGERAYLPDLLVEERERLVLKPSDRFGGKGVLLGKKTAPAVWNDAVEKALAGRNWLAQEVLEPEPFWFQTGERSIAPHNLVWGPFTFGDRFAGAWIRMQPLGHATGVINAGQGANPGIILDVPDR